MVKAVLLVGLGGFLGSAVRYLTHLLTLKFLFNSFPAGTFAINVTGSFLIGLLYGLTERFGIPSPEWRLFLATGFCGGFTTFSTFSYESLVLLKNGNLLLLFLYITGSVILGVGAALLGVSATQYIR